jgi:hypothetical protein
LEPSSSSLDRTLWFRIWTDPGKKNGVWVYFSGYGSSARLSLKIYNIVDGWQKEIVLLEIEKLKMPHLFESYEGLLKAMLGNGKGIVGTDASSKKILDKLRHGGESDEEN